MSVTVTSQRTRRTRSAPHWPGKAPGKQLVGESIIYGGAGFSIEQAASPPSIIGNIFSVDLATAPSGFGITVKGDGTVIVNAGGNTSRQSFRADIFSIQTESYYGSNLFYVNSHPPVWSGLPLFTSSIKVGVPIVPFTIGSAFVSSPDGDPLILTIQSGAFPPGLTLLNGVVSGTPTIVGQSTVVLTATDLAGAATTSPQFQIAVVPQVVTPPGPPPVPNVVPLLVPTSGTVSTTRFTNQQVIDHAFRRCKVPPQKITPEYIDTALDLLYLILSNLSNKGIALWTITKNILPIYESIQQVPMPLGSIDVYQAMLRTSQIITGTPTSSQGVAANAFDQNLKTACVQTTAGGFIDLSITPTNAIPTYGFMPAVTGTWNVSIQTSVDGGVSYQNLYTNATLVVTANQWFWVDIPGAPDGITNVRLQANGTTILNVAEFVVEGTPSEIPLSKLSRDDYINLPNKWFQGRPVLFWYDRQIPYPILTLWPVPSLSFTFNQIITTSQRYIQDPGTLTQIIEVPQKWYLPIICELANQLMAEIPEAQADPIKVMTDAMKQMNDAWNGETDGGPIRIVPNIRPYTRC